MFLFLSRYLLFPIVWPPIVCSLTLIPIFFLMSPILSPVSFPFLLSPFFYTLSPVSVPFLYILSLSLSSIPCPCPLSPVPVLFEFLNYISVLAAVCMTNYQLVVKEKTSTKTTSDKILKYWGSIYIMVQQYSLQCCTMYKLMYLIIEQL